MNTPNESAPAGDYVLVPREATEYMIAAATGGWRFVLENVVSLQDQRDMLRQQWAVMLEAAPTTQQASEGWGAAQDALTRFEVAAARLAMRGIADKVEFERRDGDGDWHDMPSRDVIELVSELREAATPECNCPGKGKPANLHAPNCPARNPTPAIAPAANAGTPASGGEVPVDWVSHDTLDPIRDANWHAAVNHSADPPAAGDEVVRYNHATKNYRMTPDEDGPFVLFTDYDRLSQQLAATIADRDRAVKLLRNSVSCVRDFAEARRRTGHAATFDFYSAMADEIETFANGGETCAASEFNSRVPEQPVAPIGPCGYVSTGEFRWACDADDDMRANWQPVWTAHSDVPFATVRGVVKALTRLGVSTPCSQEEQAARGVELVNDLCSEVQRHFDTINANRRSDYGRLVPPPGSAAIAAGGEVTP